MDFLVNRPESRVRNRILLMLALLVGAVTYGTLGFWWIEKAPLFDSFYMAVITLTTVGFDEVIRLSNRGRLFAVSTIFLGLAASGLSVGILINLFFEDTLVRLLKGTKMRKKLKNLNHHYIVCGYGITGKNIVKELLAQNKEVVVIDLVDKAPEGETRFAFLLGDARKDDVLMEAHVDRAIGLASTLTEDADNVFVTLTARALNPKLEIASRFKDEDTERKLLFAGVNHAVSPYRMGAHSLAIALTNPPLSAVLEATVKKLPARVRFAHLYLPSGFRNRFATLGQSDLSKQTQGALIVALIEQDGNTIFNPDPDCDLNQASQILILGHSDQIEKMESYLKEME